MPKKQDNMLEKFLSRKRSAVANKLIPHRYRNGRILDIGCGEYPYFLINTQFQEKYGMDRLVDGKGILSGQKKDNIFIKNCDIEEKSLELFDSEYFDVVTMLAVFEHIETERLPYIIKEIKRVLKFNGIFILTTPAAWADGILKILSGLKLVNPVMIEEHKALYDKKNILSVLMKNGFSKENIRFGNFELFINIWAAAIKK